MEEKKRSLAQAMGITRTVVRPPEESDIKIREDRVGRYFKKYLKQFIFVEFSDEFLQRSKVKEIMSSVPVPLRKEDIKQFAGGEGLRPNHIAESMAWIMGSDPKFKYTKNYVAYLNKLFNYKIYEGMMKKGRDAAEKEEYEEACIQFRAALCMKPDYLHAMYSYARVCRSMYEKTMDKEYVGRFKAESMEYFELLTETHPRFAQGYYYLGYAYLNIGLYGKAQAAWKGFLRFTRNGKDRKEVQERLKQIADPLRIEEGCNHVMALRYDQGREILEAYIDSRFNDWWPLHYYLGVCYARTGMFGEAVSRFKQTLSLNASHLETMEELADIYRKQNDKENLTKYMKKIDIVKKGLAEEQEEMKRILTLENQKDREVKINVVQNDGESLKAAKDIVSLKTGGSATDKLKKGKIKRLY